MQALLGSIAAEPDAAIGRLSILDASERSCVLDTFNNTDLAPSSLLHADQTLHGLVEHWAEATPDKPAAVFEVHSTFLSCPLVFYLDLSIQSHLTA